MKEPRTQEQREAVTSLAVQWLRLCASTAGGAGSIPGRGTKIPHAAGHSRKIFLKKQPKNKEKLQNRF